MPSAFINDGYTLNAEISSAVGAFDAFSIAYRPMAHGDLADLIATTDKQPWTVYTAKRVDWIVKKLVSWNLVDSAGVAVAINAANILRLQDAAVNEIWSRVAADLPGDAEKN